MGYIAKTPINHDGKHFAVGKPLPVSDDEQIEALLELDAIELAPDAVAGQDSDSDVGATIASRNNRRRAAP